MWPVEKDRFNWWFYFISGVLGMGFFGFGAVSLMMDIILAKPSRPAVPQSFTRMYVAQCFSNKIFILTPPFKPSQSATAAIAQPCSNSIAFDASTGKLAVASGAVFGKLSISIYNPPFSSASAPAIAFMPPGLRHPRQIAWDDLGDLWITDDLAAKVYEFRAPFSGSSKAIAENTHATQPVGLAFDIVNRIMFIADAGGARSCAATLCYVDVVPAPYTGAPVARIALGKNAPTALAVDQRSRLYVGFEHGALKGQIGVYLPPFFAGQTAAFTLHAGDAPMSLAFDSAQNLYAQLYSTGGVVRFDGPVTAPARPTTKFGCPMSARCVRKNWAGLAFGP